MTRITYVVSEYPAPSHTFIRREIAALRRRGISIETVSIRATDSLNDSQIDLEERRVTRVVQATPFVQIGAECVRAIFLNPIRFSKSLRLALSHRVPGLRSFFWALFHLVEAIILAGHVRKAGSTHIHSHFANSGATVGLLAAKFLGISWSFTVHGISETDYPAGALLGDKVRQASFVSCASWFMKAQAMRMVQPDQWEKIFVTRCGLEFAQLPTAKQLSPAGPLSIICVGRLSPEKGHAGLLSAFRRIVAEGIDAKLVLVGDGPEGPALARTVRDYDLVERVELTGRLDELETLTRIAEADVLVLPSLMEGLPMVLIEALGLGKPVVSSWVAGIPELVEPNGTGILFAPGDWERLADALRRICVDESLRNRLARGAKQRVAVEFDIDHAVRPLFERFTSRQVMSAPDLITFEE
ncbi:glycosyltransferase [Sphingomonas sp. M1-B02]|uniref:glycosyltransferase n=1 Tax=Sphingomonas sp. M1-B02 TaxID=3114300 RepID=UPI00223FC2D5|nr:glycosyltransferase [Sphingomonas sp. S6-11]UZK67737.1 glycosyltransferase [Sphingomonas sp. S6-11]